jgi:hypothetical protein
MIATTLTLSSCTLWDVLKPSSDGLSVDTEIVAGDKEVSAEVVANKETTHNTADVISNTYQTVNEQAPWWVIILLIIGWVAPTPSQMFRWVKSKLPVFGSLPP